MLRYLGVLCFALQSQLLYMQAKMLSMLQIVGFYKNRKERHGGAKKLWCVCCILVLVCSCKERPYSIAEEDVRYFFETIRKVHPDPYLFLSQAAFDSLEQAVLADCKNLYRASDLNLRLMQCNHYFDGHTFCGIRYGVGKAFRFPMQVYGRDSVVWLPTGERVVGIDTFSIGDYLQQVKCMLPHDMHPKSRNEYAVQGTYFYLLNGGKFPAYMELTDGEKMRKVSYTHAEMMALDTLQLSKSCPWRAYYCQDSMAVLEFNTCKGDIVAWQELVHEFFDQVEKKGIRHVFVDVRRNGGGIDSFAWVVLKALQFSGEMLTERKEMSAAGQKAYNKLHRSIREAHKEYYADTLVFGKAKYCGTHAVEIDFWLPNKSGYDGNFYVVQGHRTYSAGSFVCFGAKGMYGHTVLVGGECGQAMPMFGNRVQYALPNTGIPFYVGTTKNEYLGDFRMEEGFLQPDVPFEFQRQDTILTEELRQIVQLSAGVTR